jgi:hypothetical protein
MQMGDAPSSVGVGALRALQRGCRWLGSGARCHSVAGMQGLAGEPWGRERAVLCYAHGVAHCSKPHACLLQVSDFNLSKICHPEEAPGVASSAAAVTNPRCGWLQRH